MSFTAADVEEAFLNEAFEAPSWRDKSVFVPVDSWSELDATEGRVTLNGEVYPFKGVEHIGGGEGSGEYTAVIFEVGGRLFRKEGWYASHYGSEFDGDFSEVEVYEKTVKDYRNV